MKVSILASAFLPVIGGAESYAAMVAQGLINRGVDVEVLTDLPPAGAFPNVPEAETWQGVSIRRFNRYLHLLTAIDKIRWEQMAFSLLGELQEWLVRFKPDILQVNSLETALLGAMAGRVLNIPVVACFHEQEPESDPLGTGKCHLVYRAIGLDAVLCGSKFYLERALRFGPEERAHLVYHGIDTSVFTALSIDQVSPRNENAPVVVCAARLKQRKGIIEFVKSMPYVIAEVPDVKFVIAGSISSGSQTYADMVKATVERLGLSQRVTFVDDITFDKMPAFYQSATVAVAPSLAEGLGLSVLEAMACGIPVVTTAIPGIVEIFEGFSLPHELVPPGDSVKLAEVVVRLISNQRLRAQWSVAGVSHVKKHFSRDVMIDQTIRLYRELLEEKKLTTTKF